MLDLIRALLPPLLNPSPTRRNFMNETRRSLAVYSLLSKDTVKFNVTQNAPSGRASYQFKLRFVMKADKCNEI